MKIKLKGFFFKMATDSGLFSFSWSLTDSLKEKTTKRNMMSSFIYHQSRMVSLIMNNASQMRKKVSLVNNI